MKQPVFKSLGIHIAIVMLVIVIQKIEDWRRQTYLVNLDVIAYPELAPNNLTLQPKKELTENSKPAPEPQKTTLKKVFGVTKNSIKASSKEANEDPNTAAIKTGNTALKENDNITLNEDDPDFIPIPTDSYLVTQQVKIISDFLVPYPEEAKKNNIQGPVVMDLIIDKKGVVKSVILISGPGYGLNEAAVEAARKFKFRPAKVGEDFVAVRIRYTYRFDLKNR